MVRLLDTDAGESRDSYFDLIAEFILPLDAYHGLRTSRSFYKVGKVLISDLIAFEKQMERPAERSRFNLKNIPGIGRQKLEKLSKALTRFGVETHDGREGYWFTLKEKRVRRG